MIGRIASGVVEKLTDSTTISDTEKELYLYGFFILISQILYFIITIIMGILLDIVSLSIVFYISFQFINVINKNSIANVHNLVKYFFAFLKINYYLSSQSYLCCMKCTNILTFYVNIR